MCQSPNKLAWDFYSWIFKKQYIRETGENWTLFEYCVPSTLLEDLNTCSHLISLIILKVLEDKLCEGQRSFIAKFTAVGIMPGVKELPNKYFWLIK